MRLTRFTDMRMLFAVLLLFTCNARAEQYLILSQNSTNYALAVSAKIWKLSSPDADTNPRKTTKYWTGYIVHADGRVALVIPDDDTIRVHAAADADDLPNSLIGILTPAARAKLRDDILANRGKVARVSVLIPTEKVGNVRTKAQMQADGWFPN